MIDAGPEEGSATPTGNTYDKYGTSNPIEQQLMRRFFAALDAFLDDVSPTKVLEIGVGEGIVNTRVRERFPNASVVGIDLPDDTLATEWRARGLACAFGDASHLPFADDTFDLVLAIEVFEHLTEPDSGLRELARVGKDVLVASVPFEPIWRLGNMARLRYLRDFGNTPGHVNHWSRRGFSRFVGEQLEVVDTASPLPWTMVRARINGDLG